jgi:hypothetical protein
MAATKRKKRPVREVVNEPVHRNKLTFDISSRAIVLAAKGHTVRQITDWLGVSHFVMKKWIEKGKSYVDNNDEPRKHRKYGKFYQDFRHAAAKHRLKLERKLNTCTSRDWKRLLTLLARYDRDNWGVNQTVEMQAPPPIDPQENFL